MCSSKDHYANERHTPEEIKKARFKGKSILTYVSTLSDRRAIRVLSAHAKHVEAVSSSSSSETEGGNGESTSEGEARVADVSDANLTYVEDSPVEPRELNEGSANAAMDSAFVLSISSTWNDEMEEELRRMTRCLSADEQSFGGIVLDTACTGASVVSAAEYAWYCRDTGAEYCIEPNSSGCVKFGDTKRGTKQCRIKSLGTAKIRGYVDTFDEVFEFQAHVVQGTDTPLLLSIQDLDGLGYDMRTGTRSLWAKDRSSAVHGEFPRGPHQLRVDSTGRGVIQWVYAMSALFTDVELRKFHRSYGHSSVDKIMSALKEAGFGSTTGDKGKADRHRTGM